MAKIQIKRGLQSNVEKLLLSQGELAVALDTGNLYVGTESGKVQDVYKRQIIDRCIPSSLSLPRARNTW